jgi:heme/copper-type cytochrome/quinol oxidase subunit 1
MLDDRLHGHLHHRRDDGCAAVPPADFSLHNSLFLIAHFHNVIIGGVLFGVMAAVTLLVPEGLWLQAQ